MGVVGSKHRIDIRQLQMRGHAAGCIAHGLIWQAQCYPRTVDDLKPVLELVSRLGADHVNLQPDVRPHVIGM